MKNINFKFNNTDVDDNLKTLTESKFQALEKFIKNSAYVCDAEFEKLNHQQGGQVYRMEVNLDVAGKMFRAEATEDTFNKAVDVVREELEREMVKHNEKRETLIKRGGRKLKEMLRFGK